MKNPWTKKNPLLSMWLSGANAVAGSVRSRASAEAKRQTRVAMNQGIRQMTEFWTGALTPAAPKRSRKKKQK